MTKVRISTEHQEFARVEFAVVLFVAETRISPRESLSLFSCAQLRLTQTLPHVLGILKIL